MLVDTSTIRSQPQHGQEGSDLYFADFMKSVESLHAEQNPTFNDVVIVSGQGESKRQFRIPSIVLAAISPVFKNSARTVGDDDKEEALTNMIIIPDVDGKDFETFILELWSYRNLLEKNNESFRENRGNIEANKAHNEALMRVMDILCKDFLSVGTIIEKPFKLSETQRNKQFSSKNRDKPNDMVPMSNRLNTKIINTNQGADKENKDDINLHPSELVIIDTTVTGTKKKVGRKATKKAKASAQKPLVKKEIIQRKQRTETTYTLRKNIKKVKFTDEVSDPSDIDDEEDATYDDLSSMSESDEYKPDNVMDGGIDHEMDDSEDEDISDRNEEDFDEEETISSKDDHVETDDEDLFSIEHWNDNDDNELEYLNSEEAIGIKDIENSTVQEKSDLTEAMTMFTVKVCPDGTVEVLNQEEASKPLGPGYETAIALVGPTKVEQTTNVLKEISQGSEAKSSKISLKRKLADAQGNFIGFGRVVQIMEREKEFDIENTPKKFISASEKLLNPRSLLKARSNSASFGAKPGTKSVIDSSDPESKPLGVSEKTTEDPKRSNLVLFCSECGYQCESEGKFGGQNAMRYHAASKHSRSRFFVLPLGNPHRTCAHCTALMISYEKVIASDASMTLKDLCFPCPHCRRRYVGTIGGLANHLFNDHRNASVDDIGSKPEDHFHVIKRWKIQSDEHEGESKVVQNELVTQCDFCLKTFGNTIAVNTHLVSCPENNSGHSPGLYCNICGKMFTQRRYLKKHLSRHRKEKTSREKNFCCQFCPVMFSAEANLNRHMTKEHSDKDPDEGFILHAGCDRCQALTDSYKSNKVSIAQSDPVLDTKADDDATNTKHGISHREMAFKCPHCFMVLYANTKHAPRYLYNHVQKFHLDPEINDLTLGEENDKTRFKIQSKTDPDLLTCEFCGFSSKSRSNHNVHLSTCKESTVPCRPGFMCNTCGFVAGTAIHLRNHIESHNDSKTYKCDLCNYAGRSKRYLKAHKRSHHTEAGIKKTMESSYLPCPKCGKLRKEGSSIKSHVKKCGLGPAKVACKNCDMEFKRREDMQAHSLIHYGQVTCPIHNILFKQEDEVFQHVNKASAYEKFPRLQCCMCENQFKHMCLFMKHLRRHLRISPYRCNVCQKHLNTYASLQHHMIRIHNSNPQEEGNQQKSNHKEYSCTHCQKVFSTKGHLKEHILGVHETGTAAVNCPVCDKRFNTKKRMKKHLNNSHRNVIAEFRAHGFEPGGNNSSTGDAISVSNLSGVALEILT